MQRIIQALFLILVCTATLAGRPMFDLDEYFTLVTGPIAQSNTHTTVDLFTVDTVSKSVSEPIKKHSLKILLVL